MRNLPERLDSLDLLRGLTLVSMILYHGMWDFLYLSEAGAAMPALRSWYEGDGGHLWQQSICRTFLLLSGFCVPFSRHLFRRGMEVSLAGAAVSAVTFLFAYEERVLFGVLTFLGMAMLLTGGLKKILFGKSACSRALAAAGLVFCALLFHMTRWINAGFLRAGPFKSPPFPAAPCKEGLAGLFFTALGFPMPGFFSTDYFSLFPWIFLFWAGMFLHLLAAVSEGAANQAVPEGGANQAVPEGGANQVVLEAGANQVVLEAGANQAVSEGAANQVVPEGRARETEGRGAFSREAAEGEAGLPGGKGLFGRPLFHLRLPVLNWMGRHSLLLYLLHQPVLYLLIVRS